MHCLCWNKSVSNKLPCVSLLSLDLGHFGTVSTPLTTLTKNCHKWDKSDNSQIHTANVQELQPRINTTTQQSRQENVNSSRILEAVLTMVQQRYSTSGGAFRTRSLPDEGPPHVNTILNHYEVILLKILWIKLLLLLWRHLLKIRLQGKYFFFRKWKCMRAVRTL